MNPLLRYIQPVFDNFQMIIMIVQFTQFLDGYVSVLCTHGLQYVCVRVLLTLFLNGCVNVHLRFLDGCVQVTRKQFLGSVWVSALCLWFLDGCVSVLFTLFLDNIVLHIWFLDICVRVLRILFIDCCVSVHLWFLDGWGGAPRWQPGSGDCKQVMQNIN